MPDYATKFRPAAQVGILIIFLMHLVDSPLLRNNNQFSRIFIAMLFVATIRTRFHKPIKTYLVAGLRNTARGALFCIIALVSAVVAVSITEYVIPGLGRALRDAKWPSVWPVVIVLFVIATNLDWLAMWRGFLNNMGFEQQDNEPT